MASWLLDVLLHFLLSDVFEPLESVSIRRLVQNTLVLLLLASGLRICVIIGVRVLPPGGLVSFSWSGCPGFVLNTITGEFGRPALRFLLWNRSTWLTASSVRSGLSLSSQIGALWLRLLELEFGLTAGLPFLASFPLLSPRPGSLLGGLMWSLGVRTVFESLHLHTVGHFLFALRFRKIC